MWIYQIKELLEVIIKIEVWGLKTKPSIFKKLLKVEIWTSVVPPRDYSFGFEIKFRFLILFESEKFFY